MCNEYEQQIAYAAYCRMMQVLELGMPTQQTEIGLPMSASIGISKIAPVMRVAGNVIELAPMRFSFRPASPKGGPIFNYRSEGRRFDKTNRCLIPASAFFEFKGTKYPKSKYRLTLNGAPFLCIAGIWREGKDEEPPAFTMLTTSRGPDIAPIRDRQIVVLRPEDWVGVARAYEAGG
jgi:putative SOS response-associated peptidase YedK